MINSIVKWITGKDIILYNPHRNSKPLVNEYNKKRFIFINPIYLMKATFILGWDTKLRYKTMGFILSIIDPKYILDINWIGKLHSLYYAWCERNGKKFVVMQHGTHYGGIINDIDHKYTKCHIFLVWSTYFKELAEKDNKGKNVDVIVFGNPIYNKYDRSKFTYKQVLGSKILVAVSVVKGERFHSINKFMNKLIELGFELIVKEHNQQSMKYKSFEGVNKISKGDFQIYNALKSQEFDIVITDVSTTMNDIIFFKNRALYFSPDGESDYYINNVYAQFLKNAALYENKIISKKDLHQFVDIEAQEKLLGYLIETKGKNNQLDILQ